MIYLLACWSKALMSSPLPFDWLLAALPNDGLLHHAPEIEQSHSNQHYKVSSGNGPLCWWELE